MPFYTPRAVANPAPRYLRPSGSPGLPVAQQQVVYAPPEPIAAPGAGPLDTIGNVLRLGRGLNDLAGNPVGDALGSLFGGAAGPGIAGLGFDVGTVGSIGAQAAPAAAAPALPGLAALAPAAIPLGIIGGMALLSRLNDKPSVGESFAVRFGRGDGGLTVREVGMDNSTDTVGRDVFAGWTRDILADALGQAQVTGSLDGALTFFPNPEVNGGAGSFGARVGGETRYYATPVDALKAFVTGQHRQGRVIGDLPQVLGAIDSAVAARGTLADAAAPAYLATAREWAALGGPERLAAAERLAGKAQRAYGAFGGPPPDVSELAERRRDDEMIRGTFWDRDV